MSPPMVTSSETQANASQVRESYRIPLEYVIQCKGDSDLEQCPMIVFVNSRSGGRAGEIIHEVLGRYLGFYQIVRSVFWPP